MVQRPEPRIGDDRYGGCGYTSARLISKNRVALRYGLVQARIRVPVGYIRHYTKPRPADDGSRWPACVIDQIRAAAAAIPEI